MQRLKIIPPGGLIPALLKTLKTVLLKGKGIKVQKIHTFTYYFLPI